MGGSRHSSFGDDDLQQPPKLDRSASEYVLSTSANSLGSGSGNEDASRTRRSRSPPPLPPEKALSRAIALSKKLSGSNIPSHVTETGDLMLDMTGYKSSEEDALRAEIIARKVLAEELEGDYDIGALIGADEQGNLWIYSSEEAKEAARRRTSMNSLRPSSGMSSDAVSDPGYQSSDSEQSVQDTALTTRHHRTQSDAQAGFPTPPQTPPGDSSKGEPTRNYAKTLRLTSDQLKALNLKPGPNPISFTVNKATVHATMYLWSYKTPIVISDIDGTITKYVIPCIIFLSMH